MTEVRLIDLSSPVDATLWEPDPVTHRPMSPEEGAQHMISAMREHFGVHLDIGELPCGEFLNNDTFTLTAHTGTHVDAPAHYGSVAEYGDGVPRTIDQLPLDWFEGPGFVLDVSDVGVGVADADRIEKALWNIGYHPAPGDIALLRTGADRLLGTPDYFTTFTGLDGSAVDLLLDFGIRVVGTDAFSLDAPFPYILRAFTETGDRSVLWPAHFRGRQREYCQIERLAHLDALPRPYGFRFSCYPVKLARAGAGWARAVARLPV